MEHQVWTATGLSCSHCINSISTNLLKIDGLDNVEIDLKPNEKSFIRTSGSREISAEEISNALRQAGKYLLSE